MPTGIFQRSQKEIERLKAGVRKGTKHSEKTKQKIREARLGKSGGMLGKHHSEKTKRKMSETRKRNPTRYWLGKKPNGMLGKHHTEETKRKMSLVKKGKPSKIKGQKRGGISTYKRKLWLNNQRRIKKLGNEGFHSLGDWENLKAQYNWTCPCCKKSEPEIKLSEDHIIPLSKGGSDNIENIQPLCRNCNSKKHTKNTKYEM